MNGYQFTLAGAELEARGSGALYWADQNLLCVSDLRLGTSGRASWHGGADLPPYETQDTLSRLDAELAATQADTVICLGGSFGDHATTHSLPEKDRLWIARLQAGRRWVWIEGTHPPGPVDLGGTRLAELPLHPLSFRHIAQPGQSGELSGHYHPKARLPTKGGSITRPCFLIDGERVILPAFGVDSGGLSADHASLTALMRPEAIAVLTGPFPSPIPIPR
jgi:DNA ligase-associated metallophosphoesterase